MRACRRRGGLALLFALGLAGAAATAEPAAGPEGRSAPATWYAQALAASDAGLNVTHFWSKGPALRAETVVLGHKVVTIVRGDRYITYDAISRVGLDLVRTAGAIAADQRRARPFGNEVERLRAQGAEKVGEEKVQGAICDVYRITDPRGRREVWALQTGSRLPVRVAVFDRSRGARIQTDYLNWQTGLPIEDAWFAPEPGIEFQRMSAEEYTRRVAAHERVGPLPILYADLLTGDEGGPAKP